MIIGQVAIGDPVVVQPGVYIPHGQVVVDGMVEVGTEVALLPFVTVGLRAGSVQGPTIGPGATIGTGAKVLGPVRVGAGARVWRQRRGHLRRPRRHDRGRGPGQTATALARDAVWIQ